MNEREVWRDVPGYVGHYQVSTYGRVKSLLRIIRYPYRTKTSYKICKPQIILSHKTKWGGYLSVGLAMHSIKKKFKVHRLVAMAFISNPEKKPFINHKNGIKTDNRVINLEWCTRSENATHAVKTGLMVYTRGEKCHSAKLSDAQVIEIKELSMKPRGSRITLREIAENYGVSLGLVEKIKSGERPRVHEVRY